MLSGVPFRVMERDQRDLAHVVAELEQRVRALEDERATHTSGPAESVLDAARWWLLEHLAGNTGPGFTRDGVSGSVAYGGRVSAPGTGELVWQLEHGVPDVLDADLGAASAILGALSHPVRLEILRRLMLGAHTLGELQELAGTGTSGQIHHHLRELRAAGLIVQPRRSHYAIPAERVVPCLVIIAAALGRAGLVRPAVQEDASGAGTDGPARA